jgi:hypothetical protein
MMERNNLTAETGDLISSLVNENQPPLFKMLTMPMFTLASSIVNEDGTQVAAGNLVKWYATTTAIVGSTIPKGDVALAIIKGFSKSDSSYSVHSAFNFRIRKDRYPKYSTTEAPP